MSKPHQQQDSARKDVARLSDQELHATIARMFNNWCWISGDSEEQRYYAQLVEEVERRKAVRDQARND